MPDSSQTPASPLPSPQLAPCPSSETAPTRRLILRGPDFCSPRSPSSSATYRLKILEDFGAGSRVAGAQSRHDRGAPGCPSGNGSGGQLEAAIGSRGVGQTAAPEARGGRAGRARGARGGARAPGPTALPQSGGTEPLNWRRAFSWTYGARGADAALEVAPGDEEAAGGL